MFLISIKAEYEHRIKKILRTKNSKYKIDIFTEDDIYDKNNYSKYKYVITNYNKNIIDYFLNLGKKIIIIDDDEVPISSQYFRNDNIKIIKDVNEITSIVDEIRKKKSSTPKRRVILKLAVVTIMIFVFLIVYTVGTNINFENTKKEEKIKQKVETPKKEVESDNKYKKDNFLFLGDSITDFYDLDEYYEDLPVVNSGKSGHKCEDILKDMENRVYKYNPTKVFLLIGTNDINFTDITNEELVDQILEICNEIAKNRKNAKIYVESIYPVNRNTDNDKIKLWMVDKRNNTRIQEINKRLEAALKDTNYKYIDMYSALADENGDIKLEYTNDGLHMSDEGYKVITKEIKKIIEGE